MCRGPCAGDDPHGWYWPDRGERKLGIETRSRALGSRSWPPPLESAEDGQRNVPGDVRNLKLIETTDKCGKRVERTASELIEN